MKFRGRLMKKKKGLENWTFTEHTDHKMNRGKLQIIYLTTMFRTEIRRESKKYERWKRQETVESNDCPISAWECRIEDIFYCTVKHYIKFYF